MAPSPGDTTGDDAEHLNNHDRNVFIIDRLNLSSNACLQTKTVTTCRRMIFLLSCFNETGCVEQLSRQDVMLQTMIMSKVHMYQKVVQQEVEGKVVTLVQVHKILLRTTGDISRCLLATKLIKLGVFPAVFAVTKPSFF